MNCLRCQTSNDSNAKFCKSCGLDLSYVPPNKMDKSDNSVVLLVGVLCVDFFIRLGYLFINKIVLPAYYNDTYDEDLYLVYGWSTDVFLGLALLAAMIFIQNNKARVFLILFLVSHISIVLGYRVFI